MNNGSLGRSLAPSLLVALAVAGCPAAPVGGRPCDTDTDCPTGSYCEGGGVGCTFECRLDLDCDAGERCTSRGRCEAGGADGGVPADGSTTLCRTDADCDDGTYCNGSERCAPGAGEGPDGCVAGAPPCATGAACDEAVNACRTTCDEDADGNGRLDADNDGDGHRSVACGPAGSVPGDDCDDADADRFPRSLAEICDPLAPDHDEDCDPCTVASYIASDGDRDRDRYYGTDCSNPLLPTDDPASFTCPVQVRDFIAIDRVAGLVTGTDCNDDPTTGRDVHPTEAESCNGIDDNCSGEVDEGVQVTVHLDCDGDTYGDPESARTGCVGEVASATDPCPGTGRWILAAGDPMGCDFGVGAATRYASAVESCNGIDDDCDGAVDDGAELTWYRDGDGDGFGNAAGGVMMACDRPSGYAPTSPIDCDDAVSAVNPSAVERCDVARVDENCDGSINMGCVCSVDGGPMSCTLPYPNCPIATQTCRMDAVGSSWGPCSVTPPTVTCYVDADIDGWAPMGATSETACACRYGWTTRAPGSSPGSFDCNDGDPNVSPEDLEQCNGIDDNCVRGVDEDLRAWRYRDFDGDGVGAGGAQDVCRAALGYVDTPGDCRDSQALVWDTVTVRIDQDADGYCVAGATYSACVGSRSGDLYTHAFVLVGGIDTYYSNVRVPGSCLGDECYGANWYGSDLNAHAPRARGCRYFTDPGPPNGCGCSCCGTCFTPCGTCTSSYTFTCDPGYEPARTPGYDRCSRTIDNGGGSCSVGARSVSGRTATCTLTQTCVGWEGTTCHANSITCEPCTLTGC